MQSGNSPLVSVVIPTYERPHFLKLAVDSVLRQTYRNLEIFITDNSRDDRTKRLMDAYDGQGIPIRYEHHPEYTAWENWKRARDYDNPKAEYVNWLMDDDLFAPAKLERMVQACIDYPDVSLATSRRECIDPEGRLLSMDWTEPFAQAETRFSGHSVGTLMLTKLYDVPGEPTTAFVRKSCLTRRRFSGRNLENGFPISDVPTWLDLLSKGNLYYIPETLSYFRLHPHQDSGRFLTNARTCICWGDAIRKAREDHTFLEADGDYHEAIAAFTRFTARIIRRAVRDKEDMRNETSAVLLELQSRLLKEL